MRQKITKIDEAEDNSDRFGELPDSLLVEILSLLPMRDAVRTGVLSKRWTNLWTLVDRIRFYNDEYDDDFMNMEDFVSFVDHTLMQCVCSNLKEFSLHILEGQPSEPINLPKWLEYVMSKNVKFIYLRVEGDVPCLGFGQLSWFSLEKLHLKSMMNIIDEKDIANILSGCPILDTLILENILDICQLNITSPKLRKLKVLDLWYFDYPDSFLEINAPWLKELEISVDLTCSGCRLVDVSSLVFANVTFAYEPQNGDTDGKFERDMAIEILKKLYHVEELIVGRFLIQAMSVLEVLGKPSPLFECKKLTIKSVLRDYDLPGIACLLKSSPHLEALIILMRGTEFNYFGNVCNFNGEKYLSMQKGNFLHLKNVRVVDGRQRCARYSKCNVAKVTCPDFEVVAYLLRSACTLEKFIITSPIEHSCECSINCAWQYLSSLSNKLIYSCLDGNGSAKCEFRKKQSEFEFIYKPRQVNF